MATQSRNVYITGNSELDRILNDIAARLDIIEGLRPDLAPGYYKLDSNKGVDTNDLDDEYQQLVDNVNISGGTITITAAAGNSIIINGRYLEIYDKDGALIHKIGSWT